MTESLQDYFTEGYEPDLDHMATRIIDAGEMAYWAGRRGDLEEHLQVLLTTFSGLPFLCFYHAGIIVQIRRSIMLERNVAIFNRLWNEKQDVLLETLSSRWLVAACDTIIDVSADPVEQALALNGTILINITKLYESERYSLGKPKATRPPPKGTVHLFDGVMRFSVGNGDMISNMVDRAEKIAAKSLVAGKILMELFDRMSKHDTVFKRFAVQRKKIKRKKIMQVRKNQRGEK
jgi:hypothetical protein